MSTKVTQRDIAETVIGLKGIATDMLEAANTRPNIEGLPPGSVLVSANVLARHSRFLEAAADELLTLIPEKPVAVPP